MRPPQSGAHVAGATLVASSAAAVSGWAPAQHSCRCLRAARRRARADAGVRERTRAEACAGERGRARARGVRTRAGRRETRGQWGAPDSSRVRRLVIGGTHATPSSRSCISGSCIPSVCQTSFVNAGASDLARARGRLRRAPRRGKPPVRQAVGGARPRAHEAQLAELAEAPADARQAWESVHVSPCRHEAKLRLLPGDGTRGSGVDDLQNPGPDQRRIA